MPIVSSNLALPSGAAEAFRLAMRRAATGVTLVSTAGPAGRFAQTVSAVCSVSLEPPTLLACVDWRSPVARAVMVNGVFVVSVLSVLQARVADVFAGRAHAGRPYDFDCAHWTEATTGCPLLANAPAGFDCRLTSSVDAGSHAVLLGAVLRSEQAPGTPLVHYERAYTQPVPLAA